MKQGQDKDPHVIITNSLFFSLAITYTVHMGWDVIIHMYYLLIASELGFQLFLKLFCKTLFDQGVGICFSLYLVK